MSVQRIVSRDGRTDGWQARCYVAGKHYLSAFFASRKHGGVRRARALAQAKDASLQRRARRMRRQLDGVAQ